MAGGGGGGGGGVRRSDIDISTMYLTCSIYCQDQ